MAGMSAATPLPARTVTGNVRAELARIGMPAYKLPDSIGGTRSYWGRRMTGELPFSVDDLLGLAGLCNVHPGVFFDGVDAARPSASSEGPRSVRRQGLEPRTRYVTESASEDGIARILPADSNPDLAASGFEADADVVQLPTWRNQPGVIREAVAR